MRRRTSRVLLRCVALWAVVGILVSLDVSRATRNPLFRPQQQLTQKPWHERGSDSPSHLDLRQMLLRQEHEHRRNPPKGIKNWVSRILRGGSTILQPSPSQEEPYQESHSSSQPMPPQLQQQEQPQQPPSSQHPPMQHQQNHQYLSQAHGSSSRDQQQQQQQALHQPEEATPPPPEPQQALPKINLRQVTQALKHTSEWNQKLTRGIRFWGQRTQHRFGQPRIQQLPSSNHQNAFQHNMAFSQDYQHYGNLPVNVHPSRTWEQPIRASSGRYLEEEELSLFHAKQPRAAPAVLKPEDEAAATKGDKSEANEERKENTVNEAKDNEELPEPILSHDSDSMSHWGPDLLPYLEHICESLGMRNGDTNGIELVLAMIYLDRASSKETLRTNGILPCPFLNPRTVHRLSLAALVLAKRATTATGDALTARVAKLSASLGIPQAQLDQMVEWMAGALGDAGWYVTAEDVRAWHHTWESFFAQNSSP